MASTFDVFLSFRGEDTRYSFTDHLYNALHQAGISTFRDDDEIGEGQPLKPEIETSITQSRASIVVLSENFANSSWCLDELCLILDQKRNRNYFVLPVFYKVDPSDVRNQRGSFKIQAKEGVNCSKWTVENVNRWKAALTEVANLKGKVVSGYETEFISNIVEKIYNELDLKLVSIPTTLTGMDFRARAINSWLENEQHGSPVLAICGMGGSGKTTLAKYVYNSNKQNFERSCFLEAIENQPNGLLGLKKQLVKDILGNNKKISNVSEGTLQIEKIIHMKKVLIVIDDIDDKDRLITLLGTNLFHTQSKIIITTRLLDTDTWFGSISYGCHINKIELLNYHESLELLSLHAFGSKIPMKGFEEHAGQLALYCEGNPLALKVLGSSLAVRSRDQRTRNNMIEVWRSRMNSLNSLKGDLDRKIQVVLQKSFESLPCDDTKELFLHIACLLVGNYAFLVEMILEDDLHAKSGIVTLANRCLVSQDCGKLVMHKLLQDMAKKIVDEESKDPAARSRVWRHDESYHLLRKGDGSEKIKGLVLDMGYAEQEMVFKSRSLVKMKNLRLLQLKYVKLDGPYENFPDLRWLRWRRCYLKTIPRGLLTSSLVAIDMSWGDLEKFEPPMGLNSLKILDLTCCHKLVSISNLNRLPKLETLLLLDCTSLTHVCETIGDLQNLSFLELSGCTKLWNAKKFVNQVDGLKALFSCGGIQDQPSFSLPQSLSSLGLGDNPFDFLPSFLDISLLHTLVLSSCPNLKSLPCLPSTLQALRVDWCSSLEIITFQSARFKLTEFSYEGCFKLSEIQGLFKLSKFDAANLGHMQWIKEYHDHKVDLVGDVITRGRTFNIQILYEYGIRSTYLQDIKDESMATHEYTSPSHFISFHVPLHPKKHRIQGLNVTFLYKLLSSSNEVKDTYSPLFAKISNLTKGVTWVYNPVVFCKSGVDNDVVWLSNWPIGSVLDVEDEVHVEIYLDNTSMIARGCGVSLAYMDDDEVEKEEKCESRMKGEEMIGGDLSQFEVTKGGYFLCRTNIFGSGTPGWLKWLFGDNNLYTDSRRWRVYHQRMTLYRDVNTYQNPNRQKLEIELGVSFKSESDTDKIERAVSSIAGVESVLTQKKIGRLTIVGRVNPQKVAACVREFENMVQVLVCKPLQYL